MPSREFRPPLFAPDDGLWRGVSISAFIGMIVFMGWLSQAQAEPTDESSVALVQGMAVSERGERQVQAAGSNSRSFGDRDIPLKRQLLKQARHGKVNPALLLETFIEQEEAHGGGDARLLMDEFLRRSTLDSSNSVLQALNPQPIELLAELKAQMVSDPDLVYVSNAYSFTEVLLADRLQCQSTTMTIALAWLQHETTQSVSGPRPVLVMSMNHVQPGLLYKGTLHLMEGTSRGDRVAKLHLAQLGEVRVVDAADALTWTLLRGDTPPRMRDRMLLFDNLEGGQRFRTGSGSDSWLHLPHTFGKSIVLSSSARPLSRNTDPAKMLLP